ncbi:MAG: sugar ABC transporter permease [candidate division NC10 bacterium]|nr:sugar ABC transporter permease [candidate division NC10 bacterium]
MPFRLGWRGFRGAIDVLFLAPLTLYILGLTLWPVLSTMALSFQDRRSGSFPTLANYQAVVEHFEFWDALYNTLFISVVGLSLELCLGLVMALCLSVPFRGRGVARALMLIPLGVPTIVSAANMRYIFGTVGYLNETLHQLGLLEIPIDWTSGGARTLMAVVAADLWKVTPLVMLILLAGLESIPGELYEAAVTDGAGAWQRFRYVTLPLLKPAITAALIIRGIDAFRIFALPLTLVGRSTPVLSTYTYFEYVDYQNPYTSAASATILLVMILATTIAYLQIAGTEEVIS